MAKAKKYGARLLNLVVNLFRLIIGCSIIILISTSMLFVAVWMRVRQARELDNTVDGAKNVHWRSQPATEDSHGEAS